ncbi:hypothetical protein J6590_006636 [Homalodisca vitripennis]|nr:hypothetical protein J6590_006636 [Homalodisca vitripennis]
MRRLNLGFLYFSTLQHRTREAWRALGPMSPANRVGKCRSTDAGQMCSCASCAHYTNLVVVR